MQKKFNFNNRKRNLYKVIFHNVGQGLFAEAELKLLNDSIYRVVYDCGTSSRQSILEDAVASRGNRPVDLLVISHFDHDHISGILKLLEKSPVRQIMLPMMTKELRVASAFLKKGSHTKLTFDIVEILSNPISAIKKAHKRAHPEEEEPGFILVAASSDEEEIYNDEDISLYEAENVSAGIGIPGRPENVVIRNGSSVDIGQAEFILRPYNDKSISLPTSVFKNAINYDIKTLIDYHSSKKARKIAFDNIVIAYRKAFGNSPRNKNLISLFIFISPEIPCGAEKQLELEQSKNRVEVIYKTKENKSGILFTGDGFLDSPSRLKELRQSVALDEAGTAVIQVMHHGSRGSWYRGLAQSISPTVSVFSSDPLRKSTRHPHESVLKDFSPYNPIQVDKENNSKIQMWIT